MTFEKRVMEELVLQTQLLRDIKMLMDSPAYVVDMGGADHAVANSLIKKITGRKFKPGEVLRLTNEEFKLYNKMQSIPKRG